MMINNYEENHIVRILVLLYKYCPYTQFYTKIYEIKIMYIIIFYNKVKLKMYIYIYISGNVHVYIIHIIKKLKKCLIMFEEL